jgi:hypothetical protein
MGCRMRRKEIIQLNTFTANTHNSMFIVFIYLLYFVICFLCLFSLVDFLILCELDWALLGKVQSQERTTEGTAAVRYVCPFSGRPRQTADHSVPGYGTQKHSSVCNYYYYYVQNM